MKKKLTLLIFLLPVLLFAQTEFKNGTISIDFGKKNRQKQDTIKPQQPAKEETDEEEAPKPKREKKQNNPNPSNQQEDFNFKRDGLFKGLVHIGLNACQIDGDSYWGYNYPGLDVGVGTMARFHKFVSVSLEITYSMKGAKQAFLFNSAPQTLQKYRVSWDYITVPVSIDIHDKKLIILSLGLSPGYMVRFRQRNEQGADETNNPNKAFGDPRKFDLSGFGNLHFLIKKNYALGLGFSYSLLKIRGPSNLSRVNGQYNNVLTFRFMALLDKAMFKKK